MNPGSRRLGHTQAANTYYGPPHFISPFSELPAVKAGLTHAIFKASG